MQVLVSAHSFRSADIKIIKHPKVTEATRISDGIKVILKKVDKRSNEAAIATYLSNKRCEDNHCVPIFEIFEDETDGTIEFIVMPLLRRFDSPSFDTVDEVIDFMRQTLKVRNACFLYVRKFQTQSGHCLHS